MPDNPARWRDLRNAAEEERKDKKNGWWTQYDFYRAMLWQSQEKALAAILGDMYIIIKRDGYATWILNEYALAADSLGINPLKTIGTESALAILDQVREALRRNRKYGEQYDEWFENGQEGPEPGYPDMGDLDGCFEMWADDFGRDLIEYFAKVENHVEART